eukprot:gene2091-1271_t
MSTPADVIVISEEEESRESSSQPATRSVQHSYTNTSPENDNATRSPPMSAADTASATASAAGTPPPPPPPAARSTSPPPTAHLPPPPAALTDTVVTAATAKTMTPSPGGCGAAPAGQRAGSPAKRTPRRTAALQAARDEERAANRPSPRALQERETYLRHREAAMQAALRPAVPPSHKVVPAHVLAFRQQRAQRQAEEGLKRIEALHAPLGIRTLYAASIPAATGAEAAGERLRGVLEALAEAEASRRRRQARQRSLAQQAVRCKQLYEEAQAAAARQAQRLAASKAAAETRRLQECPFTPRTGKAMASLLLDQQLRREAAQAAGRPLPAAAASAPSQHATGDGQAPQAVEAVVPARRVMTAAETEAFLRRSEEWAADRARRLAQLQAQQALEAVAARREWRKKTIIRFRRGRAEGRMRSAAPPERAGRGGSAPLTNRLVAERMRGLHRLLQEHQRNERETTGNVATERKEKEQPKDRERRQASDAVLERSKNLLAKRAAYQRQQLEEAAQRSGHDPLTGSAFFHPNGLPMLWSDERKEWVPFHSLPADQREVCRRRLEQHQLTYLLHHRRMKRKLMRAQQKQAQAQAQGEARAHLLAKPNGRGIDLVDLVDTTDARLNDSVAAEGPNDEHAVAGTEGWADAGEAPPYECRDEPAPAYSFQPAISPRSRALAMKREEYRTMPVHERLLLLHRLQREAQELRHGIAPDTGMVRSPSQSPRGPHAADAAASARRPCVAPAAERSVIGGRPCTPAQVRAMLERGALWQETRAQRLQRLREEVDALAMEECTFTPQRCVLSLSPGGMRNRGASESPARSPSRLDATGRDTPRSRSRYSTAQLTTPRSVQVRQLDDLAAASEVRMLSDLMFLRSALTEEQQRLWEAEALAPEGAVRRAAGHHHQHHTPRASQQVHDNGAPGIPLDRDPQLAEFAAALRATAGGPPHHQRPLYAAHLHGDGDGDGRFLSTSTTEDGDLGGSSDRYTENFFRHRHHHPPFGSAEVRSTSTSRLLSREEDGTTSRITPNTTALSSSATMSPIPRRGNTYASSPGGGVLRGETGTEPTSRSSVLPDPWAAFETPRPVAKSVSQEAEGEMGGTRLYTYRILLIQEKTRQIYKVSLRYCCCPTLKECISHRLYVLLHLHPPGGVSCGRIILFSHASTKMPPAKKPADDEENHPEDDNADIDLDPLLVLYQCRHTITSRYSTKEQRDAAIEVLSRETLAHHMAPLLRLLREALDWSRITDADLAAMDAENAKKVALLEERRRDAEENLGDTEVREVILELCKHYYRIGDLHMCMSMIEECSRKTIAPGLQLDLCFMRIRLGIAFENNEISAKGIQDAHRLLKDSNWERRNRLKVYEGIYHVIIRDFRRAAELLLDSITTFASGELIDFKEFIFVTTVVSLPVLKRVDVKKKIIESPEVISAESNDSYLLTTSLYNCKYKQIFPALDIVCQHMRRTPFLAAHINYFFREARAIAFAQFLDSYSRVTLKSMSASFAIPEQALDELLSTMISNDRLPCRMDRVNGSIKTYRGDSTNIEYHRIIKNGDLLLNRLQKLTRQVEI